VPSIDALPGPQWAGADDDGRQAIDVLEEVSKLSGSERRWHKLAQRQDDDLAITHLELGD
jgi:hypothetical protein